MNRMARQSSFCLSALYPHAKLHRLWVGMHVGAVPRVAICCASARSRGESKLVGLSKRKPEIDWVGGAFTRYPRSAPLEGFGGVSGPSRIRFAINISLLWSCQCYTSDSSLHGTDHFCVSSIPVGCVIRDYVDDICGFIQVQHSTSTTNHNDTWTLTANPVRNRVHIRPADSVM